ncbi:MarR family transcriptional regulator [Actinokineospora sp. NBRC 105648]|uniref:MarR family winged helix-turn-helix transcriptional regulator n=1 Tax=Actinokineospora sp. NBRC 105648 TaxID=3032206 RepID=UPI0024A51379|nr:MarR family transcriptional regulator [Actinokineospora sp. NBRC 105648]GLZ43496.1 MarR family transcriptional regulator [Actinokineospora sp. NBRC 105648]
MGTSWDRLVALHSRIEQELARALTPFDLGLSEYRALSRLAVAPHGELRMQNLAEAIGLNQSSVSRLVARLDQADLTARTMCADDRRGIYSAITAHGRERQSAAEPAYEAALEAALDLAAGDPDLADLVATLR